MELGGLLHWGGVGVSIFLIISGYGLNESWKKTGYLFWWRKRIVSVLIPYWIIQFFFYWPQREFDLTGMIKDFSFIHPTYVLGWYLQYLMIWYIVFYVVRRNHYLDNVRILIFLTVSIILFFSMTEIAAEQSLSFLVGILISEYKDRIVPLLSLKKGIILICFGVIFLGLKQLPVIRTSPQIIMNFVQLCIKSPCGLGLLIFVYRIGLKSKVLNFIGSISYELYIIHGYILGIVPVSFCGILLFLGISFATSYSYMLILQKLNPLGKKVLKICDL